MLRRVDPEILDSLPSENPEAIGSRRDLRWINGIMGNYRWLAARIRARMETGCHVLEMGAGEGILGSRLVRGNGFAASQLTGLDRVARPAAWPAGATWIQGDVFSETLPEAEIVVANLFLHHFSPDELKRLGSRLPSRCRHLICSEPARRALHIWQGKLLAAVARLNRVTRHDMAVSIRAGFLGRELPEWLGISDWKIRVTTTLFGAYRLEAHRT